MDDILRYIREIDGPSVVYTYMGESIVCLYSLGICGDTNGLLQLSGTASHYFTKDLQSILYVICVTVLPTLLLKPTRLFLDSGRPFRYTFLSCIGKQCIPPGQVFCHDCASRTCRSLIVFINRIFGLFPPVRGGEGGGGCFVGCVVR